MHIKLLNFFTINYNQKLSQLYFYIIIQIDSFDMQQGIL